MSPEEMKEFQQKLRDGIGNIYKVNVDKILTPIEAEQLVEYVRKQHNDPDANVQIYQPVQTVRKPDFEFEIVSKNNLPISNSELTINEKNEYKESSQLVPQTVQEAEKIYGENWIVLQNRLLNAISNLTIDERRLIMFLSPIVRKAVDKNPNRRSFEVIAKEFGKEYDISDKHVYDKLKKATKSIHGKVFYYWDFKTNRISNQVGVSWVGRAEYKNNEGVVEVLLIDEVIEMLTVFDKAHPFTKYERKHIVNLGPYGIILYELISSCMHQEFKNKFYDIEYLREKFNCTDTYLLTAEFRRCVIDKAIRDIHKNTSYKITYEIKRTGRKVVGIVFSFENTEQKNKGVENKTNVDSKQLETAKNNPSWQTKGLSDNQINKIKVHMKEFVDANTSQIAPEDRRDYPEIFEFWRSLLKSPETVNTFHKIQELLHRPKTS